MIGAMKRAEKTHAHAHACTHTHTPHTHNVEMFAFWIGLS